MSFVDDGLRDIEREDPEVGRSLCMELQRQRENIELIASENIVSEAVLAATGSILTNKYAEGYSGRRYYGGCEYIDEIESLAVSRAKELFGAEAANVQPHSGAQANMAAYWAVIKPGDTVLGLSLAAGGHLTHGSPVNASGKLYDFIGYGTDPETGLIDYDGLESLIKEKRPKLVVTGASAYPRIIDFERISRMAHENGALCMVDMAHVAGLVVSGDHPSPVPYADIVTTTTHKTLRGPRGGLILCKEEFAKKVNSAIFPGTQGGPLEHVIAGKAICFREAMQPEFCEYQQQIVRNSKALAKALLARGFQLVTGGTDNHLSLIDLRPMKVTGVEMQHRLDTVHITANKNAIPNDPEKPTVTSGLRVGTPAITSRGFTEEDMEEVAELIYLTASDYENRKEEISARAVALCGRYPIYQ
ncbi:MAG: serine hydroxymethyltransferase [Oscillospiraceae bacterium]|nr:serine hydroxymethyltransferase [Oscillospiraceae bacterium]